MENIISIIGPYLPYIGYALPFVLGIITLVVQGRLKGFARETVAAVYRVAIHSANALQDEGIAWLRSEAGIVYRRQLAARAYDALPVTMRGIPVGLIKTVVSRDAFCTMVESAFSEVADLAEKLELPEELPTA